MYRLMIVDDEHHIVNWLAYLFEGLTEPELEIEKAYSGGEALRLLENRRMDIILLDIQMPGLNGIETGRRIRTLSPGAYIIFLTGYSDFNYIYQATQMDHISYLLKSEDDGQIIAQVMECIRKIDLDRRHVQLNRQTSTHELLVKHFLQMDLLRELLSGKSIGEVRHLAREFQLDVTVDFSRPFYAFYVRVFSPCGSARGPAWPLLCREIPVLVDSLLAPDDRFAMIPVDSFTFLWLFQPWEKERPVSFLKNLAEEILASFQENLSCFCILLFCTDELLWQELYDVYLRFTEYNSHKLPRILSETGYLSTVTRQELTALPVFWSGSLPDQITLRQLLGELQNGLLQYDSLIYFGAFEKISRMICSEKSMHNFASLEIYMKVSSLLIGYINQHALHQKLALKINLYPLYYITGFDHWNEACSYLSQLSQLMFQELSMQEKDRRQDLISMLKQYIESHLHEDLSLGQLSGQFNYNSSYLSHLFKQITGTRLSDYITDMRIDRASQLLRTSSRTVSEIAELTGFDTAQYFSYVYKRKTGITPGEYRISQSHP